VQQDSDRSRSRLFGDLVQHVGPLFGVRGVHVEEESATPDGFDIGNDLLHVLEASATVQMDPVDVEACLGQGEG
jgi:hypothetical protein